MCFSLFGKGGTFNFVKINGSKQSNESHFLPTHYLIVHIPFSNSFIFMLLDSTSLEITKAMTIAPQSSKTKGQCD